MAKGKGGSHGAAKMNSRANVKLGDIHTAAKSTMGPTSYETGYPANENELTNAMPAIIRGKSKG